MAPWSIQGHCLSIQRWEPSIGLTIVDLKEKKIWVQIHEVGPEKFNTENAQKIGNSIGKYIETDREVENLSKSYLSWISSAHCKLDVIMSETEVDSPMYDI